MSRSEVIDARRTSVLGQMWASLRGYWRQAAPYQRFLYWLAMAFLASAAVHGAVFVLDDRAWEGPLSWRKPMLFSFSFAALSATIAWIMTFLPARPQVGWPLGIVFAIASVGETALIALQAWRGEASHFNDRTPFDEGVFVAMGFLIVGVVAVMVILTVWSLVSLRAPTSLAWSIRLGLILLVAGLAIGGIILAEGQEQADLGQPDSPVRFGEAGVMNVPHALAIHALQALPVLGWILLFTRWDERKRLGVVLAGAAGYALIIVAAIAQAAEGRAPLDPSAATGALTVAGAIVVAFAYVAALVGLSDGRVESSSREVERS